MTAGITPYIARTCELLGPRFAVQAGLAPRVQRSITEWSVARSVGVLLTAAALIGLIPIGHLFTAFVSAVLAKGIWHTRLMQQVQPDRLLSAGDMQAWMAHARDVGADEQQLSHALSPRAPVSTAELAHRCAALAVQEAGQARRKHPIDGRERQP